MNVMRIIATKIITACIKIIFLFITAIAYAATNITGAGATFPAPLYVTWADIYQKETGNKVNYQSIGTAGGIKQIISNTVDFGASDTPLSDDILNKKNLFQFPIVIGGVVIAINLEGIKSGELVLDGQTLAEIYLGKIKKWDDKLIAKINPGLKLPSQNITVVRRADGSGTSFIFTNYLAKVNNEWKSKLGYGSTVNWPIGIGGKGNEGIAALVQRLPGSIGYVEYAYAKHNNLIYTKLISANGNQVLPTEESFLNAAKNVNWNKSLAQDLTNKQGDNVWPITSTTFIIVHKEYYIPEQGIEVLNFFNWAYQYGGNKAKNLGYACLPDSVITQIRNAWKTNVKVNYNNILQL